MVFNLSDALETAYICGLSTYGEAMLNYELHERSIMADDERIAADAAVYRQLDQLLDAGLNMDDTFVVTQYMRDYEDAMLREQLDD